METNNTTENKFDLNKEMNEVVDKSMNTGFNFGIQKAIDYCNSQAAIYLAINPIGNEHRAIKALAVTLEHFKKAI